MQYLQQNKVNYLSSSATAISFANNGIIANNTTGALEYFNNSIYHKHVAFLRFNVPTQENTTSFNIATVSGSTYLANVLIYNFKPSFTCNNIISMTSNDSVTYTVNVTMKDNTTITKEYTFLLKKQFMNTPILTDVLNVQNSITKITISATSDINLTLPQPKIMVDDHNNFANVTVLYL